MHAYRAFLHRWQITDGFQTRRLVNYFSALTPFLEDFLYRFAFPLVHFSMGHLARSAAVEHAPTSSAFVQGAGGIPLSTRGAEPLDLDLVGAGLVVSASRCIGVGGGWLCAGGFVDAQGSKLIGNRIRTCSSGVIIGGCHGYYCSTRMGDDIDMAATPTAACTASAGEVDIGEIPSKLRMKDRPFVKSCCTPKP